VKLLLPLSLPYRMDQEDARARVQSISTINEAIFHHALNQI
jgi:hypothetical protein